MPAPATDPVPVEACIGGRELTEPRLSPDATMLVHAVSAAGESALVLRHLAADGSPVADARIVTSVPMPRTGRGLGGGCWCWSADASAVVYAAVDGNVWWQSLDGGAPRQLTAHGPERVAQAPAATADGSRVVYVLDQSEVWCLTLADGRTERLDAAAADFCFDPATMPCSSGAVWLEWNVPHMPWERARVARATFDGATRDAFEPPASVQQPRLAPDGTGMCVRDDTGWMNVWLGDAPLVAEPVEHGGPTWGLGQRSFAMSPDGSQVAFTRNERGFGRLCVVDVASRQVTEVGRGVHGQLSWEGDRLACLRSGARTPTQIVSYDTSTAPWTRATIDVASPVEWADHWLVEPELVEVPAVDGSTVHARLYRAGQPSGRLICWLHGGPTDQWQVSFLPRIAYWRSRGWNVLVPDHRGSTGHGREYQRALDGRWGELDVADTAAAIAHAHLAGWGDAAHTALFGSSAGGFTVLGTLARHPALAAAAAVAYPVSDLFDLAERSHRFERHSVWTLVGEPGASGDVDARYRDRSPVWFAHLITTPLLIVHGDADPVVPVEQSRVLFERIRATGGDVELVVYPGEGHGLRQREHQLDEYARITGFLDRHVP